VLIGLIGLVRSQLDASLGAGVGVLDRLAVGGGQVIQLIDAVADGVGLPLYVGLAGEWVHTAPETLTGRCL